jgi:membrane protein DedA with SNARE-associated domain
MWDQVEYFTITNLQNIYDGIGWFGVTGLLVFENATGFIPSEVILGLAGWMLLAAHDAPFHMIFSWGAVAALGSTAGASVTYWVANLGGRPIVDIMAKWLRIDPKHILNTEQRFQKWGAGIVFFGRMIPGVRTLINIPAGLTRMRFLSFSVFTFFGTWLWCTFLLGAGYLLGHEWRLISDFLQQLSPWLLGVGVLVLIFIFTYHKYLEGREI